MSTNTGWRPVPRTLATRERAKQIRAEALAAGATVVDFSACEFITGTAADELVCNGHWTATTGENGDVRETVEKAQRRRGLIPQVCSEDEL